MHQLLQVFHSKLSQFIVVTKIEGQAPNAVCMMT